MFVDASALVAMMTDEADTAALAGRLAAAGGKPITSPIAVFETAAAVARVLALMSTRRRTPSLVSWT